MPRIFKIKSHISNTIQKVHDSFYDSPAWRKIRAYKLKLNPFCEYCQDNGRLGVIAKIVDHYLPRALWPGLSFTLTNLRSCCDTCHQRKRAIERQFKVKQTLIIKLEEYGFRNAA
ncbi:MAG TPA: HNH endonuclease signature motif containing protein [Flavobacterium sp.]|nr:HNH endonuclease signature motif containing protein [Flavobacterium sp.]